MDQAATSSSAIVSSGGEHVKRPADPTVERKSRDQADAGSHACCQCLGTAEYTEGCPGCKGDGYNHNAQCLRRAADRAERCKCESEVGPHVGVQAQAVTTAVHVGAANQETSCKQSIKIWLTLGPTKSWLTWQSWNEHPHPHENEKHAEWKHHAKGYLDEDDRTTLDPEKVRAGVEREMAFMGELGVGETVQGRDWCGQRAGVTCG